jgi:hypothetical protein
VCGDDAGRLVDLTLETHVDDGLPERLRQLDRKRRLPVPAAGLDDRDTCVEQRLDKPGPRQVIGREPA